VKLSIVDQSPVPAGFTAADALNNTIQLARLADRLGYERYWIAEHHATASLACPAPEVMLARLGAETKSIRIGSGGVMLPHYSPTKVAEQFKVLHALYPGRVDLGLGRAPGGSPLDSYALQRNRESQQDIGADFPRQLMELFAWFHKSFPIEHPFARLELSPDIPGMPELWLLGSSMWSAAAAAQVGLPYAFAHFIDPIPTRNAIEHYRAHFRKGEIDSPRVILALGAIAAETDEEAQCHYSSVRVWRRRIQTGGRGPIPTPEQALEELAAGPEPPPMRPERGEWPRLFVGEVSRVRDQLLDMASVLGIDEIMIVTVVHSHQARMRSYELLAKAFGLKPRM